MLEATGYPNINYYYVSRIRQAVRNQEQIKINSPKDLSYDQTTDQLFCKLTIGGKEHQLVYFGKDISSRESLQISLNCYITRIFRETFPQESKIPYLDISEFILENHLKLIELVKNISLSAFNITVLEAKFSSENRRLYVQFQYRECDPNECYYDSDEIKSMEDFVKAVSIDVGIMYQRTLVQHGTPFQIGWGRTSLHTIGFSAMRRLTPSIKFKHYFDVKPEEIMDFANGKLKIKTVYELANGVLRAEGRPDDCVNVDAIQDAQLPVFKLPSAQYALK